MRALTEASVGNLDPAQATELSLLVDLEACWENLRKTPSPEPKRGSTTQYLQGKQKAYDAFRAKLVAYNKRWPLSSTRSSAPFSRAGNSW